MLEPLFRCNLACAGCGKIDYPEEILNQRLSVDDCLQAVDECGAPVVSIAGGEPLLHKEIDAVVAGIIARRKFVYLCTNALLMKKRLSLFKPSPYFVWSVHLDGDREMHDRSVCEEGVYDRAVAGDRGGESEAASASTSTARSSTTPIRNASPGSSTASRALGVDGITVSPGYAYERAPDQAHFLNRAKTKQLFRDIFRRGHGGKAWSFSQSGLFLDFLAGNQEYKCTPWGNPTRTVFGWQRPCYLLGEGYAKTFGELMDETDWDSYGTGNYEKCADCMVHSGFEATAVQDAVRHPLKALRGQPSRRHDRRRDGARDPARAAASGAIRVLTARRAEAVRDPGNPGPAQGVDGRVTARATAMRASTRVAHQRGQLPRRAQRPNPAPRARLTVPSEPHAASCGLRKRPCRPDRRSRGTRRTGCRARRQTPRPRATPCRLRSRRSSTPSARFSAGVATIGVGAGVVRADGTGQTLRQRHGPSRIDRPARAACDDGVGDEPGPGSLPRASPPAMPKLMIAAAPRANSRSSAAASRRRRRRRRAVLTPGPAAIRASMARPVTATMGRASIAAMRSTYAHMPNRAALLAGSVSGCESARAPRAGRTSNSRGSAGRTLAESRPR